MVYPSRIALCYPIVMVYALRSDRIARYLEKIAEDQAPATLDELFQRMTEGETLSDVCREWDIHAGRLLVWLMADEKRYALYLRALEIAAHELVAEAVAIADDDGTASGTEDATVRVARAKLRIDTRMKVAEKHAASLYGAKQTGGAGGFTVIVKRNGGEGGGVVGSDTTAVESDPPPPVQMLSGEEQESAIEGWNAGISVSRDGRTLTVDV